MWVKGFIQTGISGIDEAIFGSVHLVKDVRFYAGEYIGIMELSSGQDILVKQHPCGTFNGSIIKEEDKK